MAASVSSSALLASAHPSCSARSTPLFARHGKRLSPAAAPSSSRIPRSKRRLRVEAAADVGNGATDLERLEAGMAARRAVDKSERLMESPYAPVESTMTSPVVTVSPDAVVGSVLEQFEHFTGLPVVDGQGHCIGILSSIDVFRHQRQASPSVSNARVRDIMTSPAIVIVNHAPIAYAAGLMLKHKVHRLPVVDNQNVVVGIVTRTDLYEPLMPAVNPLYHRLAGHQDESKYNF